MSRYALRSDIKDLVRRTVQETLDGLFDEGASASRAPSVVGGREKYRSGHYARKLVTGAGGVEPGVSRLRGATFRTAVIERFLRRGITVE